MEQEQIIPTRHKSKIPRTLSYPIGAKAISEALVGVPQFAELTVEFLFWNQLARHHGTAAPYRVLVAHFSGPLRYFSQAKSLEQSNGPRWTITVDAVPRLLRHAIQTKIMEEALPAIRSWLLANTHSNDREGGHGLVFKFDELKSELTCEEQASIIWQTTRIDGPR